MNEDYLWDKTGQPDPEIQQLEEILGSLRYQPKPLELPHDLPGSRRWNYFPMLAIAASVLLALLAAGIWLRVRTSNHAAPRQTEFVAPPSRSEEKTAAVDPKKNSPPAGESAVRENGVAVNSKHRHRSSAPSLAKHEREEAIAAKEQVMLALRLASEKLNLAHRKTQSTTPANQLKNQHKVG